MSFIEDLKLNIQIAYEDFMWKYGEERLTLARNRLKVHEKNMRGECPVNPYFSEDNENWDRYID
jgi:hypothetical protein